MGGWSEWCVLVVGAADLRIASFAKKTARHRHRSPPNLLSQRLCVPTLRPHPRPRSLTMRVVDHGLERYSSSY